MPPARKATSKEGHSARRLSTRKRPHARVEGFFDTITSPRNKTILKSEQDKIWTDELNPVIARYA